MSEPDPGPSVRTNHQAFLRRAIIVSTFGGLLFGFDTGVINGALPYMREPGQLSPIELSQAMEGVIASSLLIGAAIGALAGGRLADRLGRRRTILVLAVIFTVAATGCATAPNVPVLVLFRIVLGLGVGGASVTVPAYLAEISPMSRRGRVVTRNELMIVTGQFLAFTSNAVLGNVFAQDHGIWRWMLAIAVLPAVALWVGMNFMPESPRWYALRRRYEDTFTVLLKMRSAQDADTELTEIRALVEADRKAPHAGWRELVGTKWMRRVLALGILIAVVNQITGVNSIMYYGTQIIAASGLSLDSSLAANVGNGLMSLVAMAVGIWLLGYVGRRRMVIAGLIGTTAMHVAIGTVCATVPEGPFKAYTVLALTMAFLAFMQGAVGPATWVLLSEIFPGRVRGIGMGTAVFLMWTTNFVITLVFPWAVSAAGIGISATFFVFAAFGTAAVAACIAWLPETKGKSLEQIEWAFAEGRIPR